MSVSAIHAKVFLEGVEIPFKALSLSVTANQPSTLTIAVTAARELVDIRPRTIVQVFADWGKGYKVFFEGEVVAHSYSKSQAGSSGREMSLVCMDLSNTWQYAYKFYLDDSSIMSFSTSDTTAAWTGDDPTEPNKKKERERVFAVRGIGERATKYLRETDVITGIRKVFSSIKDINEFYQSQFSKFKLEDRFYNLPDDQIKNFMTPDASDALPYILKNQPTFTPILQVMGMILQSLYHTFWSFPIASPGRTGDPVNFTLVPANFLTAPPKCNVIFPNMHSGFSYQRPMLAEPTRFELVTGETYEQGVEVMQFWRAPSEWKKKIEEIADAQKSNQDKKEYNLLIDSSDPDIDEVSKGIIPQRAAMTQGAFQSIRKAFIDRQGGDAKAKEAATKELHKVFASVAEFEYLLRKFQGRTLTVNMAFNPYICPAFPVLLIDNAGSIFGSPLGLTHTISAHGHASTSINCAYARHRDVIGNAIDTPPPWINKSFVPEAVGQSQYEFTDIDGASKSVFGAYPDLIATQSIVSQAIPAYATNEVKIPETQEEAAALLLDLYQKSGERDIFTRKYVERDLVSYEDLLSFLDLEETNKEELKGDMYDAERRNIAVSAKIALRKQAIAET